MKLARIPTRLALLACAIAVFIGLTAIYARSMRPPRVIGYPFSNRVIARHRRPPRPQPGRLLSFFTEGLLIVAIAVAGRQVLRLRLTD
jgi:hypothetical protein